MSYFPKIVFAVCLFGLCSFTMLDTLFQKGEGKSLAQRVAQFGLAPGALATLVLCALFCLRFMGTQP